MNCWSRYPAFYYGLALICGVSLYYGIWFPILIGFTGKTICRIVGYFLLSCALYASIVNLTDKNKIECSTNGTGYFQINKIRKSNNFGKKSLIYEGIIKTFVTSDKTYYDIRCFIQVYNKTKINKGNCDYVLNGNIIPISNNLYKMNVEKWTPINNTYSTSELRFTLKNNLKSYLKKQIKDFDTYSFFAAIGSGETENKYLAIKFNQSGLRHLLAISGFHYSCLIMIFGFFLNLFLQKKLSIIVLIILTSIYFTFIGESPSLNRAWMSTLIYLIGSLIYKNSCALNALGVGIIFSITLDPFCILNVGYQLSYAATFAILTIYPYLERKIRIILPKRQFKDVENMNYLNKHGYILSSIVRLSIGLTLSVTIICIPISLYHFNYFPLSSIFFNLFFPFVVTTAMIALIVSLSLPYIGEFILHFCESYMRFWLDVIFYGQWQMTFLYGSIGLKLLCYVISAIIVAGLYGEEQKYQLTLKQRNL